MFAPHFGSPRWRRADDDAGIDGENVGRAPRRRYQGNARMQIAGVIKYRRGHIKVLERDGIERCACEYNAVVKREYDRLLPPTAET